MATLGQKQEMFSFFLGRLLAFAYSRGYKIRLKELLRSDEQAIIHALSPTARMNLVNVLRNSGYQELGDALKNNVGRGIKNSLHTKGLAVDLYIFRDGLECKFEDYQTLGKFWKELYTENRWGGDFPGDIYHFSIEHAGIK